jgi:arylsulfatase A-like enzyme
MPSTRWTSAFRTRTAELFAGTARSPGAICCIGFALAACVAEEPPKDFRRLLEAATAATLGRQTRVATGPTGVELYTGSFAPGEPIPSFVGLPDFEEPLVEKRLLLNIRIWNHPDHVALPGVRVAQRSRAVAVDTSRKMARVPLNLDLGAFERNVRVQVIGFPLPDDPTTVRRYPLTLPPTPVLEFGYGLREESWQSDAERTRFRVELEHRSNSTALVDRIVDPTRADDRRWFDERIDLQRWAGEPVTLKFTTTREQNAAGHSLPTWSDPIVYKAEGGDPRPNVIVVSIDTLRSRNLRAYGYQRNTAPFIDSLAETGALFEDAITTSVTTAPSHMSLFTGLYPVGHGIRRGSEVKHASVRTLAEVFRAADYQTVAFTENGYLVRPRGFGEGFGEYTENRAAPIDPAEPAATVPTDARVTFSQARDWMTANQRRPFFAFIHTYEVHTPYRARPPHASKFADDGLPGPEDPDIRKERDNYDREIGVVDDELRALFATLESRGLDQNSIVVVLADHGEEFHEHGLLQHGGDVYDEALRIPLIFWSPGRIGGGLRIAGPVSLIDVAPTLLDLVGLPQLEALDGVSLRDALLGTAAVEPRQLFAEAVSPRRWVGIWQFENWNPPLVAVRSSDSKFIVHRPTHGEREPTRRFDLVRDPLEREPLPVVGAQLAQVEALVDGYLSRAVPAAAPPVSPDVRDRLRALGYGE